MGRSKSGNKDSSEWMAQVTCPSDQLVLFARQLQVMLRSGVTLVDALDTLTEREDYPEFGRAVRALTRLISQGHLPSRAMRLFPKIFDLVFVSLVAVGEETGQLESSLERLATWKERDLAMKRKIISAMTYPALVLTLTVLMTGFLFYAILPGFLGIFKDMGTEIPWPTTLLIGLTNMATSPFFWLLATVSIVGGVTAFTRYARTSKGSYELTLILLSIPLLGPLFRHAGAARYASAVSTMLETGMDLMRALLLAAQASGSPAIRVDAQRLTHDIMMGGLASVSMAERPEIYPSNLLQMVKAGEEASDLPEMYKRAANFHEEEASYLVEALGAALEPMMLLIVAIILGFVLISVFLPLYSHLDKF